MDRDVKKMFKLKRAVNTGGKMTGTAIIHHLPRHHAQMTVLAAKGEKTDLLEKVAGTGCIAGRARKGSKCVPGGAAPHTFCKKVILPASPGGC